MYQKFGATSPRFNALARRICDDPLPVGDPLAFDYGLHHHMYGTPPMIVVSRAVVKWVTGEWLPPLGQKTARWCKNVKRPDSGKYL